MIIHLIVYDTDSFREVWCGSWDRDDYMVNADRAEEVTCLKCIDSFLEKAAILETIRRRIQ